MKEIMTIFGLVFCSVLQAHAQKSEVYISKEAAINGYDAVAYFTDGKPIKGDTAYSFNWHNATWYFASYDHLEAFKRQPENYAPQFGGYCAYGISEGHKAPTQPDAWTIVDGKLYLNYNKDVQQVWKKDQTERIMKANSNWQFLKDKE